MELIGLAFQCDDAGDHTVVSVLDHYDFGRLAFRGIFVLPDMGDHLIPVLEWDSWIRSPDPEIITQDALEELVPVYAIDAALGLGVKPIFYS
jgi:hypothetical protein